MHGRRVFLVAVLIGLAVTAAWPSAGAVTETDPIDGVGVSVCRMVGGRDVCVAVEYGPCELWVSAGLGACVDVLPEDP